MAEKGGKGFSVPKGKKSTLKSSSTPTTGKGGGKDSTFSKLGKKVQFDSSSSSSSSSSDSEGGSPRNNNSASAKSNSKFSTKGDWGKGGKGGKTGGFSEGKTNVPKVPETPNFQVEEELPKNARCLMDYEAVAVLQGIEEQFVILSEDPTIKLPGSFHKGLQYAKSTSSYTPPPQSVRQVLETLKKHNVSDSEICLIGNICPETADELFALMPSLKENRVRKERDVKDVLCELAKLKGV